MAEAELTLSQRTYHYLSWGLVLARDPSAAINLAGWAYPVVTANAAETLAACGADRKARPRPAGGCEPGTGIAPELTGLIGGPEPRPQEAVSAMSVV